MEKHILKNETKDVLIRHVLNGKYLPGERLSLPAIAQELEVSVTPIREALTQLAETGIVNYIANRGFFLSEMSATEAQEAYELIALLESSALKGSSFSDEQLDKLDDINNDLINATDSITILELDREFHSKLIENYQNRYALRIVSNLRVQISLYELNFWHEIQKANSTEMHSKITHYIREGKREIAAALLKENWKVSMRQNSLINFH